MSATQSEALEALLHPGHGLHAARDGNVILPAHHCSRSEVDGLLRRAALPIDGGAWHLLWPTCREDSIASDIV